MQQLSTLPVAAECPSLAIMMDSDPIISQCPSCQHERLQQWYAREELIQLLRVGAVIKAYCLECDEVWDLSLDERTALARRLNS